MTDEKKRLETILRGTVAVRSMVGLMRLPKADIEGRVILWPALERRYLCIDFVFLFY